MQEGDSRNGGPGARGGRQGRVYKDYKRIKLSPKVWQDWRARQEQLGFTTANELAKYLLSLCSDQGRRPGGTGGTLIGESKVPAGATESSGHTTTSSITSGSGPVFPNGSNGDVSPT